MNTGSCRTSISQGVEYKLQVRCNAGAWGLGSPVWTFDGASSNRFLIGNIYIVNNDSTSSIQLIASSALNDINRLVSQSA